jgi:glutamate mutase epsilon subunit
MSSKKRKEVENDINSKKAKTDTVPDFVKDGLDTNEIRNIVQDIMIIIQDNKNKMKLDDIINNIKTMEERFISFADRYPMLFDMVTREQGFDYQSFEYFLSKRDEIIKNKKPSDDVHKQVGQEMFDKYYKK